VNHSFEDFLITTERLMTAGAISPQFATQLINRRLEEMQRTAMAQEIAAKQAEAKGADAKDAVERAIASTQKQGE